jgi:hypothetical protein
MQLLRTLFLFFILLALWSCTQEDDTPILVATEDVLFVGGDKIRISGRLLANREVLAEDHGFEFSTQASFANPIIISLGEKSQPGRFIGEKSGFKLSQTYFVRAFATNSTGTGYGNEISFSTASVQPILPQVSIQQVTLINNDSARCGGVIGNDGGSPVTARGLVWDVNPDPTVNLSTKTISGSGTGAFLDWMTGLSSPTTYYVRAYGTNGVGTSYSDEISFTTVSVFNTLDGTTNMAFFPNPVKEFAILEIDKPIRISSFIFYSSEGKEINLPFEKTSEKSFRISTASLKSGIYFLKIGINGGSKTLKIVK